jgi:D-xylose transport system ATP-binding protein
MTPAAPILRTEKLTKSFSGTLALQDVDFDLRAGEIHALCGENGAGKSTLIKTLSGLYPAGEYDGRILLHDKPLALRSIRDAEAAGIAVIYQELALVNEMTVAENIFLGHEPTTAGFVNRHKMARDTRELLEQFGIDIDPDVRLGDLGVGKQQLVEIVKALRKRSGVLILDEPTAALTEQEVDVLLDILRRLREEGIACIYISHKLDEVFAIADRITVLRDGRAVATRDREATTPNEIIHDMVGREIDEFFPRQRGEVGKVLLAVEGLYATPDADDALELQDITLEVRAGEILGLGGLMGAGRSELLMHLFGLWGKRTAGEVKLAGQSLPPVGPQNAIARGLVLVSEDRKRYGLVLEHSLGFNLSLSSLKQFTRAGFVQDDRLYHANQRQIDAMRIKAAGQDAAAESLSGGNQQKVVLGKALMTDPQVVLLDEPTRGIDIGAKQDVYNLMNELTAAGKAVVMVSSEMPELLGMSDRIVMLHEGKVGGTFDARDARQEDLLAAAMGRGTEGTEG